MTWQVSALVIGIVVFGVAVAIIVLCLKLRSARRLAAEARGELAEVTDLVARLLYEIKVKELPDDEAIKQLHNVLDAWSPTDDPVSDVDSES